MKDIFKNYKSTLILLFSVIIGGLVGSIMGEEAIILKPFGELFLNLLFMILVPLVFFSVVSAISSMNEMKRLGKILKSIAIVFLGTSILFAIVSLPIGILLNPAKGLDISSFQSVLSSNEAINDESISFLSQLVNTFTVNDFSMLFNKSNMLALILISILTGVAIVSLGNKAKNVSKFMQECADIVMKIVDIIMLYAPIGLGCYFAAVVGELGGVILEIYIKGFVSYTATILIMFFIIYTIFAYISGGRDGVSKMFKNIIYPAITSIATASSAACIPSSLKATSNIGIPKDIRETVIPLGANLQKHGSVVSSIFKALLLFTLLRPEELNNPITYIQILGVSLLASVVAGAIPSGGMLGEMLIVTLFGFSPETVVIIGLFGTVVDIPATFMNVTGDTLSAMLVARNVEGKKWIKNKVNHI